MQNPFWLKDTNQPCRQSQGLMGPNWGVWQRQGSAIPSAADGWFLWIELRKWLPRSKTVSSRCSSLPLSSPLAARNMDLQSNFIEEKKDWNSKLSCYRLSATDSRAERKTQVVWHKISTKYINMNIPLHSLLQE